MAQKLVNESSLSTIADAIRAKTGGTSQLAFPDGFASAIASIVSGEGGSSGSTDSVLELLFETELTYAETTFPTTKTEVARVSISDELYNSIHPKDVLVSVCEKIGNTDNCYVKTFRFSVVRINASDGSVVFSFTSFSVVNKDGELMTTLNSSEPSGMFIRTVSATKTIPIDVRGVAYYNTNITDMDCSGNYSVKLYRITFPS